MPELPEVEVTRRQIEPLLIGRRIREVHTTEPSYLFITPPAQLRRSLSGRTVGALARRGKYLVAQLDDGSRFVLHLGMTGQLFSESATSPRLMSSTARSALPPEAQRRFRPDAHTHLRICFEDAGPEVLLRDVRKFGKLMWLRAGEKHPRLDRLGIDALEITGEVLFGAGRKRKVAIKNLLLDQSVLAGVGNIYADEALFLTGVRPTRAAGARDPPRVRAAGPGDSPGAGAFDRDRRREHSRLCDTGRKRWRLSIRALGLCAQG